MPVSFALFSVPGRKADGLADRQTDRRADRQAREGESEREGVRHSRKGLFNVDV